MRIRWILRACALAVLAGCNGGNAGAPTVDTEVKPNELYAPGASYDLTLVKDKEVHVNSILSPLDSVWKVLPSVFLELGIDPGTVDERQHYVANTSFKLHRSLGDARISKYLDCGSTISGKTADEAEIVMSLTVQVVADSSDLSTLRSQVLGDAFLQGVTANKIQCATTGLLEERIAHMVNDALAHRKPKTN